MTPLLRLIDREDDEVLVGLGSISRINRLDTCSCQSRISNADWKLSTKGFFLFLSSTVKVGSKERQYNWPAIVVCLT
jgi:hypothetical protein